MAITPAQLKAMQFGYLCGQDLMQFCPSTLLIKQLEVDPNNLLVAVTFALSELIANLKNLYNIDLELENTPPIQATATATVAAGVVTGIAVNTPGSPYTVGSPLVTLVNPQGQNGSGAIVVPVLTAAVLTGLTVSAGGTGYTLAPIVNLYGGQADPRSSLCVKVSAVLAISAALGNSQAISEKLVEDIRMVKKDLLAMRNGQLQLPLQPPPNVVTTDEHGRPLTYNPQSKPELVRSSFSTLG